MKAEGIAFKEEKSGAIVIGTNPGYQNGVLIVYENELGWHTDCSDIDTEQCEWSAADARQRKL